MKITRLLSSLFALTLCLAFLTSAGFAKPLPLNNPLGLAVDSAGNLYVANHGANQILVYNSGYTQQTTKNITSGLNEPTGVQIDANGNLWVANYGTSNGGASGSIAEYTNGVLQSSNTITTGIVGPQNMVFDELGDLWVNNNGSDLTVYITAGTFGPPATLQQTISISNLWAVGEGAGVLYTGTSTNVCADSTIQFLMSGTGACFSEPFATAAFARDNAGGVFAEQTNQAWYLNSGASSFFVNLPFTTSFNESGMAVDNVHHRLYVSNRAGNHILVYSTASTNRGTLIHTI
jgi:hypothetical protein